MASSFYITAVSGGNCLTKVNNGMVAQEAGELPYQQWIVEKGDKPNVVAFRNVGNERYLHANNGNAYGAIDTAEKQWWTLESGHTPGSYWIKCNDYKDAYLCNANGNHVNNSKVYCWPKQDRWTHALTWYLKDSKSSESWSGEDGSKTQQMLEELKKKEAELAQKEKDVASAQQALQNAKQLQNSLSQKEENLAAKEAELRSKAADLEKKEQTLSKRKRNSGGNDTAKETELAEREKKLLEREAELKKQTAELSARGTSDAAKEAELKKREVELERKEKALQQSLVSSKGAGGENVSNLLATNQRLQAELDAAKQTIAASERKAIPGLSPRPAGGFPARTSTLSSRSVAPPSSNRPPMRKPARDLTSFDSDLVERFKAGQQNMKTKKTMDLTVVS